MKKKDYSNSKTMGIMRMLLCTAVLTLAAACSGDGDTGTDEATGKAADIEFRLSFADYNASDTIEGNTGMRRSVEQTKTEVIPMGDLYAEVSLQRDTAAMQQAAKAPAARAMSDGAYTIYAYQGSTLKGTLTGTVTSNVFTPTSPNQEIGLEPGVYTFVCCNDKVAVSGENWTVGLGNAATARIGVAENVTVTATPRKQQVSFVMRHVGSRARVRLEMQGYPVMNVTATLSSVSDIPTSTTFNTATRTYTSTNAAWSENLTSFTNYYDYLYVYGSYLYFLPGTAGDKLKLTFTGGTAYKLPVTGRSVTFPSSLLTAQDGSYVLNVKLYYNYIYLYSDGTTGQYTDAAHASKTPIAMVVSQSKRLAVALKDATYTGATSSTGYYLWSGSAKQNSQSNTTMSATFANHLSDFNGEDYTHTSTYSTDGIVKGTDNTNYPAFYAAAQYNPGVTVTGANVGRWFLPTLGEWNLYNKNIKLANQLVENVHAAYYYPDDFGFQRVGGNPLRKVYAQTGSWSQSNYLSSSEYSTNKAYVYALTSFQNSTPPMLFYYTNSYPIYKNFNYYGGTYEAETNIRPFVHY